MLEPLTNESARAKVREWLSDVADHLPVRSQRYRILEQLGLLCAAHSADRGEDIRQLAEHLRTTEGILENAWYASAPPAATKWLRDDEAPTEEEQKIIAHSETILWKRHDPNIAYSDGFESKEYFSCEKGSLVRTIAEYLSKPWLRYPPLDHIFLDMLITNELCAYGEWIKQTYYPDKSAGAFYNKKYYDTKGKLADLAKPDWNYEWEKASRWFSFALLIPAAVVWTSFHFNYPVIGWLLVGAMFLFWAFQISRATLKAFIRAIRGSPRQLTPLHENLQRFLAMYDVWRHMQGPVVNPTRVREAMQNTANAGAVWDNSAWALIDRAVSVDPAVWVTADV